MIPSILPLVILLLHLLFLLVSPPILHALVNATLACTDGFSVPLSLTSFPTPSRVITASTLPYPYGIPIGVFYFPFESDSIGGAEMARDYINDNHPAFSNGTYTIVTRIGIADCTDSDLLLVDPLIIQSQSLAFSGPICSGSTPDINLFAGFYEVPMLSPTVTASEFSDKAVYPYFSRVISPQLPIIVAILRLLEYYNWRHVNVITTNEEFGDDFVTSMTALAPYIDVTISNIVLYTLDSGIATVNVLEDSPLLSTDTRIFVLWGYEAVDVIPMLSYLSSVGLLNPGNVWIIDDELWLDLVDDPAFDPRLFDGFLSIRRDISDAESTSVYLQFISSWLSRYGVPPTSVYAAAVYDTVYALGTAIGNLLLRGEDPMNGPALNDEIRAIKFVGVYGNYSLDSNGDPDDFPLQLSNVRLNQSFTGPWIGGGPGGVVSPDAYIFNIVGSIGSSNNVTTGEDWTIKEKVKFPGYADDDFTIPQDVNFKVSLVYSQSLPILSFVCCTLGCWCALILCEQLLFDYKQWRKHVYDEERRKAGLNTTPKNNGGNTTLYPARSASREGKTYVFYLSQFLLSLSSCSLSLSLCGIFATIWINQYQLSLSNSHSISYISSISFTSILPITFLVIATFWIMLYDYNRYSTIILQNNIVPLGTQNPPTNNTIEFHIPTSIREQSQLPSNTVVPNPNVKTTQLLKASSSNTSTATAATHKRRRKVTRYINLYSKWSVIGELWRRFSPLSFVASVTLYAAILIANSTFLTSLQFSNASFTVDSRYLVLSSILTYIGCTISLQGFIYLVRYRPYFALLMAGSIMASNQLCISSIDITYNDIPPGDSSDTYNNNVFFISGLSITAVTSLLLLSLQFSRMRISRNQLDLLLKNLRFENEKLERKIIGFKDANFQLETKLEEKQWILDTISMIRPQYRGDLLAIQMAQSNSNTFNYPLMIQMAAQQEKHHKSNNNSERKSAGSSSPPAGIQAGFGGLPPAPPPSVASQQQLAVVPVPDKVVMNNIPVISPPTTLPPPAFHHSILLSSVEDNHSVAGTVSGSQGYNSGEDELIFNMNQGRGTTGVPTGGGVPYYTNAQGIPVAVPAPQMLGQYGSPIEGISHNQTLLYDSIQQLTTVDDISTTRHPFKHISDGLLVLLIMNNPVCLELFKDYAHTILTIESLQFYVECERYKAINEPKLRTRFGRSIVDHYINSSGGGGINISSTIKEGVEAKYTDNILPPTLFDPPQCEIFHLIITSLLPGFLRSRQWIPCSILLNPMLVVGNSNSGVMSVYNGTIGGPTGYYIPELTHGLPHGNSNGKAAKGSNDYQNHAHRHTLEQSLLTNGTGPQPSLLLQVNNPLSPSVIPVGNKEAMLLDTGGARAVSPQSSFNHSLTDGSMIKQEDLIPDQGQGGK